MTLGDLSINDGGFSLANGTLSAGDVTLGGIIAASGVALSFTGVSESSTQPLSGTIGLSAGNVTLFPGAPSGFTASVSGLTGSYTLGGSNAAPSLSAASASVDFGNALQVTDTGLTFTGTTNGTSPNLTSVSISSTSASISSPEFTGLTGTLSAFTLGPSGFDIGSASLTGSISLGSLLSATGVTLSATDLQYDATTNQLASDFGIALSAGSVSLFPGATGFTSQITGLQGTYNATTSVLGLTASEVELSISNMLELDSTDLSFTDVTDDPSQYTLTFTTGTLSSPRLSSLPSASIDGFSMDSSGFQLAQADLKGSVSLGDLLTLDQADLSVTNLDYSATGGLSADSIALTAGSVALFPGQSAFSATISGFSGSYDLATTALDLSATEASLSVGQILQLTATAPSFTDTVNDPSQYVLSFGSAVASSPQFSGLAATLTGFTMDSSGFSLAQADLTGSFQLSGLLEADGVDLSVTGLDYSTSAGLTATSIGLTASSVALFPGQTAFSSSVTGFQGTYDLATGSLALQASGATLEVSNVFELSITDGLSFDYDATTGDYSASIGQASLTSPQLTGLSGTAKNFTFDQSGFQLGTLSLTGSITVGGLLDLQQADLTVTDFDYSTATDSLDSGWGITLTAGSVSLFPGQSAFSASVDGFKGSYDSTTQALDLSATSAQIQIGSLVTIDINQMSFTDSLDDPSDYTLTVQDGSINLPASWGLNSISVDNLVMNSSGFTLGTADFSGNLSIGSLLAVDGFSLDLSDLAYNGNTGAFSTSDITATAQTVTLFPGDSSLTTTITGFALDLNLAEGSYSATATSLNAQFSNLLEVSATGLSFDLDPTGDYQVQVASATATVPQLGVTGAIKDLSLNNNGFSLGSASLSASGTISLGSNSAIQVTNPSVAISGLSYTIGSAPAFSGDLTYSASSASLAFGGGSGFSASLTNVSGTIGLAPSDAGDFTMNVGALSLSLGGALTLTGSSIAINTASDATDLLSVGTLDASLDIPAIGTLTGSAQNFSLVRDSSNTSDVDFSPGQDFGVTLGFDPGTLFSDLSLPSWLPTLTITSLGVTWGDFVEDPTNFTLDISASVSATIPGGTDISVSGFVDQLVIDPSLIGSGDSPIISISGAGLQVSGDLFGCEISGAMFLDTLELNAEYQNVNSSPAPSDTAVKYHELYGGIEASISMDGLAGLQVRLGFFQSGPLEVYVQANVPILLDPTSGLTLGGFFGSVDFGESLPTVTDAQTGFDPGTQAGTLVTQLTTGQGTPPSLSAWQTQLEGQVETIVSGAGGSSISLSDLTSQMVFTGGATLYSEYASEDAFEFQGGIAFDTQGHVLIAGSLTLGDTFSMQAAAYFNFAQVEQGQAQILVHAEFPAPDPSAPVSVPPLVTAWGELAISYSSGSVTPQSGQQAGATGPALGPAVTFDNPTSGSPTDYIETNNPIDLGNSSFSVEFWAQQENTGTAEGLIGLAGQSGGLQIGFNAAGQLVVNYGTATVTATNTPDQAWHQWAVSYDATTGVLTIYEDGNSEGTGSSISPVALSGQFLIGESGDSSTAGFYGAMDDVRLWNIALSQTTVLANMDQSNLAGTAGLVAEWTFSEGTAPYPGPNGTTVSTAEANNTTLSDSSGNGNDATLYVGTGTAPNWTVVTLVTLPTPSTTTTLTISLSGGVELGVSPASMVITGSASFTYQTSSTSGTTVQVDVSGSLPLTPLGDLADLSGQLTLDIPAPQSDGNTPSPYLYGAIYVTPGQLFSQLQNIGLTVSGFAYLGINTSSSNQTVNLALPGTSSQVTFAIPADSATIWIHGDASFTQGGSPWFELTGNSDTDGTGNGNVDGADLYIFLGLDASGGFVFQTFVDGELVLGSTSSPVFQASAVGFLQIDTAGIAAELDVNFSTGDLPADLSISGSLVVQLNTTDQTISFTPPSIPTDNDSGSQTFTSASGSSTINIPDRPTLPDGTTPSGPEPYFLMNIMAGLTLANQFAISGNAALVVAPDLLTLDIDGSLAMPPTGTTVLTGQVDGGVIISSAGLVGAVDVTGLSIALPASGFGFDASAMLEVNTTGVTTVVGQGTSDPVSVPAGSNGFFAEVAASGSLTIAGDSIANASVDVTVTNGSFSFDLDGQIDVPVLGDVMINGSLTIIAGNGLYGGLSIVEQSDAGSFQQLLASIGLNFSQSAEFQFLINTTNSSQTVTGFIVDPTTHDVEPGQHVTLSSGEFELDMGGSLTLFNDGFNLSGELSFAVSPTYVEFSADASIGILGHDLTLDTGQIQLFTSFAFYADVQFSGSLSLGSSDSNGDAIPFGVSGDFVFAINATGSSMNQDGFVLAGNSAVIGIENFAITVGSFTDSSSADSLSTSMLITVENGIFTFSWQSQITAGFYVGGVDIFTITVSGGMSFTIGGSDGSFTIGGSANVSAAIDGTTVGALSGSILFTVNSNHTISVDVSGSITVVGISYSGSFDFSTRTNNPSPPPPPELTSLTVYASESVQTPVSTIDVGEPVEFTADVTDNSVTLAKGSYGLFYTFRIYTPSSPYDPSTEAYNISDATNALGSAALWVPAEVYSASSTEDFIPSGIGYDFTTAGVYTLVVDIGVRSDITGDLYGSVTEDVLTFVVVTPTVSVQSLTGVPTVVGQVGRSLTFSGSVATTDSVANASPGSDSTYAFDWSYTWNISNNGTTVYTANTSSDSDSSNPQQVTVPSLTYTPDQTGVYTVSLTASLTDAGNSLYTSLPLLMSFVVAPGGNVLTVNQGGDSLNYSPVSMTLRQAVAIADEFPGDWTIEFAPSLAGESIDLSFAGDETVGASALAIDAGTNVTIDGSAAPGLTIDRASGAPAMRFFYVAPGASLTIDDLTLSGGLAQGGSLGGVLGSAGGGGAGLGGAIYDAGNVTITGVTLVDNEAIGGEGGVGYGGDGASPNGGNFNQAGGFGGGGGGGYLASDGDTPAGAGGFGGGAGRNGFSPAGSSQSKVSGYSHIFGAGGSGAGMGGALFIEAGSLTITDSTLTQNTAQGGDGGFGFWTNGSTQYPVTFLYRYNPGSGYGGAIFDYEGSLTITNDTIAGNTAAAGSNPNRFDTAPAASGGAGVYDYQLEIQPTYITMYNTIVAGNSGGSDVSIMGYWGCNGSNNLIQNFTTSNMYTVSGELTFSSSAPQLGALGDYGGPTETMPIAANSPAASAGSSEYAPSTDQRGYAFASTPSIGAFQYTGQTLVVNSDADANTPAGSLDLRQAVDLADVMVSLGDTAPTDIQIASSLAGQTIELASVGNTSSGSSALGIDDQAQVTIDASDAPGLIIDRASGAPSMRFFYVAASGSLTLIDLTLSGGVAAGGMGGHATPGGDGDGGAILNKGSLTLSGVTLANNQAEGGNGEQYVDPFEHQEGFILPVNNGGNGYGGALFNDSGATLLIQDSTLTANIADGGTAGSYQAYVGITIPPVPEIAYGTSGNGEGGAIYNNSGVVTLEDDTIDGNTVAAGSIPTGDTGSASGTGDGGAIYNLSGQETIDGTILAGSVGGSDLVSDGGSTTGLDNLIQTNNVQATAQPNTFLVSTADPDLGPLQDNGGPTFTMEPADGSPVIGVGMAITGITTDQRGAPRGATGGYDIGAFNRPSPIMVSSATQAALAAALSLAEGLSPKDGLTYTIQFSSSLAGQTIGLTTPGANLNGESAFAIPAGASIVLDGSQAPGLTIERSSGALDMRLFYVEAGASLTIDDLTLSGGVAEGGNGVGGGGGGAGLGGAIYDAGQLTIDGSTLVGNQAVGGNGSAVLSEGREAGTGGIPDGGNLGQSGGFGGGGGGGSSTSSTRPHGPPIAPGLGGFGGGDGALYTGGGGAGMGGGVFVESGNLTLIDSTLSGDTATGGLGAAYSVTRQVSYDVQVVSWGDGSNVPTSGEDLIIVGLDENLLEIRIFGPTGTYDDVYEEQGDGGSIDLVTANASGEILMSRPESGLSSALKQTIADLKQLIPDSLPPNVLTDAEETTIRGYAATITNQPLTAEEEFSYQAGDGDGFGGAIFNVDGSVELDGDTIYGNAAQSGGADTSESGSGDGSSVYNDQDSSGTASLDIASTVIGEAWAGSYDVYNNGGTVTASNSLVTSVYGIPAGTVQTGTGLQLTSSASSITAGCTLTLSGQFVYANYSGETVLTINWGDGSAPTTVTLGVGVLQFTEQHTYTTNSWDSTGDVYTISVTIPDFQASTTVQVDAKPVSLTASLSTANPFLDGVDQTLATPAGAASPVQTIATFTLPDDLLADQADSVQAVVNWGDGTTTTATVGGGIVLVSGQTYAIELSHAYPLTATFYDISVQVTLAGGVATIAGLPAQVVSIEPAYNLGIQGNRIVSSGEGRTNQTQVTLQGEVPAADLQVSIVDTATDQSYPVTISPNADGSGSFSLVMTLTPGSHPLEVVTTDPASNAQAMANYLVVVDTTPPTLTSFVPASVATQTSVNTVSLTLSEPGSVTLDASTVTLTYDGTVVPSAAASLSLVELSATQYQIQGLGNLATLEGEYTLTLSPSAVTDLAGNTLAASVSTSWYIDRTPPTSQVEPLPATTESDVISLTIDSNDPSPAAGVVPSGVASLAIYVSQDNGPFTLWQTVPAQGAQTVVDYTAAEGHSYAFYSIATDAAGNVESKAVSAEAGTYVPDMTPPVTDVTAATPEPSAAEFALTVSGTDSGSTLVSFAVYVKVDGGPAQLIATVPAGSPNSSGVYTASLTYHSVADGESHTYQFFSEGTDNAGNTETSPLMLNESVTGPVRSLVTSYTFAQEPLAVTGIMVQGGAVERSFIQTVDVYFNQANVGSLPALTTLIAENRIELIQYSLNGSTVLNTYTPQNSPNMFQVVDNAIELEFGQYGLGGVARGSMSLPQYWQAMTAGDGYYDIAIDLAGNGSFSTNEYFDRLLGDVEGTGTVNASDASEVMGALGETGTGLSADVNGDGTVNATDVYLVERSEGRSLGSGLPLDG